MASSSSSSSSSIESFEFNGEPDALDDLIALFPSVSEDWVEAVKQATRRVQEQIFNDPSVCLDPSIATRLGALSNIVQAIATTCKSASESIRAASKARDLGGEFRHAVSLSRLANSE